MARLARILLCLLPVAPAMRKRHTARTKSPEGLRTEYDVEPMDTWDRFEGTAAARNVSAQWSPCLLGMCWNSWGAYRQANIPGVGGIGNAGCSFFSCPGSSTFMDCFFGPCPKYFGSPACVSSSSCRSYCDLQHAGSCTYSGPVAQSSWVSWMSEFQNSPLNKLIMIEAHHYLSRLGTLDFENPTQSMYEILSGLAPYLGLPGLGDLMRVAYASMLPMMASCGSADTAELLVSGVRAFDIRPYLSKADNTIRDHHGGRGPEVEVAFSQIAAFAREHKSEIVFVKLGNLLWGDSNCLDCKDGDETIQAISDAVFKHFGGCGGGMLICNVDVTKTLGQLTAEGNVIVHTNSRSLYDASGEPRRMHWQGDIYTAPWYNQNSLDGLKSRMLSDSNAQALSRGNTTLISHQWIMTPTADDYIGAITQKWTGEYQDRANPHGCQSLACFAEVASGMSFQSFFGEIRSKYARSNFLMLDYADRSGAMDFIIETNRKYAK